MYFGILYIGGEASKKTMYTQSEQIQAYVSAVLYLLVAAGTIAQV